MLKSLCVQNGRGTKWLRYELTCYRYWATHNSQLSKIFITHQCFKIILYHHKIFPVSLTSLKVHLKLTRTFMIFTFQSVVIVDIDKRFFKFKVCLIKVLNMWEIFRRKYTILHKTCNSQKMKSLCASS